MELRNYYLTICSRMINKNVQVHSRHLQEIEMLHVISVLRLCLDFANFTANIINMIMP